MINDSYPADITTISIIYHFSTIICLLYQFIETYTTFFVSKNSSSNTFFRSKKSVRFFTGITSFSSSPPVRQMSPFGKAFRCSVLMVLRMIFSKSVSGITARLTT